MTLTHSQAQVLLSAVRKLEAAGIRYAVWSGAQAMLLAGHRRTNDVDIWIHDDDIMRAVALFPGNMPHIGHDRVAMTLGKSGEIDLMSRMDIHTEQGIYPLRMTDRAVRRRVVHRISGQRVMFADPADTVLLKAILQRGPEVGKHDFTDIASLCHSIRIDAAYLLSRVVESGTINRVRIVLARHLPHFRQARMTHSYAYNPALAYSSMLVQYTPSTLR